METKGLVIRPGLDVEAEHNGHIYAFRVTASLKNVTSRRNAVLDYLKTHGVNATFHFVPLHSSPYGQKHLGYKEGDFPITERVSSSLIRLPLYPELSMAEVDYILTVLSDGLKHVA